MKQEDIDRIDKIVKNIPEPKKEWDVLESMKEIEKIPQMLLKEGKCIDYVDDDTPDDCVICEYPDGKRELHRILDDSTIEVVKEL